MARVLITARAAGSGRRLPWKAAAAAAGVLALAVAIMLWLASPAVDAGWPAPYASGETPAARGAAATGEAAARSSTPDARLAMPRTLQGLELPGEVSQTADGRLRVTRGVRALFDHFLAALGETDLASLRTRLQAALAARLGPPATAEALALFDAYVAYHADVARNLGGGSVESVEQMRARQASVRSARGRAFSADVARAFFGEDDAYDDYVVAKIEILRDPTASVVQRAARLAALRAALPDAMRESLSATEVVATLTDMTEQWQRARGSPQELRQLRENLVGPAAADRLATMDNENQVWDEKVADYMTQRDRLQADAGVSADAKQSRLDALRAARFTAEERARINALEHIRDEAGQSTPTAR